MTTVWLALFILSSLAFLAGFVWLLVLAWRESTTWGLVSTLVPFGAIAFAVRFWEESKTPVILCTSTILMATVTGLGFSVSKVNTGLNGEGGGADLWADSSGFEAMEKPGTDVSADDFGGDEGMLETGEAGVSTPATKGEVPGTLSPMSDSPALDDLAHPEAAGAPALVPGHKRHTVVSLEDLPKLEGERAALILTDGQRFFGVIEKVGPSKVVVRKLVGGGSILFTLDRSDITEIQIRRWR